MTYQQICEMNTLFLVLYCGLSAVVGVVIGLIVGCWISR